MILGASLAARIDAAKVEPQDAVTQAGEADHGHGDAVALDEAGAIGSRVDLCQG